MKDKVLFFITSEFPYGKGETFIENEIIYLAKAFKQIALIPITNSITEHRLIPSNVNLIKLSYESVSWIKVFSLIFKEAEILKEFLSNLYVNPLRNKVLLKSLRNAIGISNELEKLNTFESGESIFYSYWLDDGAIAVSILNNSATKISRTHNWDLYFEANYLKYLPLRKFVAGKLNGIFSISNDGKNYLDSVTKRSDKIFLARLGTINFIDTKINHSKKNKLNVISISNINARKRVDIIGDAVQQIGEEITWNHFGDGDLFEQMRQNYPQGNFHGFVDNNSLKKYLDANSENVLLVNTSSGEGIPVSMMEAMSFGIPCIGTNVGGVSEIIKDGVNGFLMPADSTAEIVAEYIRKYLRLIPEDKNRLRLNAYKMWNENYNADRNYPNFITQIRSL